MIFLVFLFGIIGYKQLLGPDFSLPGALYCTLFYFVLNNVTPGDVTNNDFLLVARYLAALTLGFGIYSLLYRHMYYQYIRLKVKFGYANHVVVFSMKMAGAEFLEDLLVNNYKVILVEDSTETASHERIKKMGVVVIRADRYNHKLFDTIALAGARACVIAYDDDNRNIDLSLKVIKHLRAGHRRHAVRVLAHITKKDNLEVIKDHIDVSNADEHFEFEVFNIYSAAAKKIYDQYPPHNYFAANDGTEHAIAVVGYNAAAEEFIVENIILSHYKDGTNIKIYLVDRDADHVLNQFVYQYPYYKEFVDIVPVKLLNNKFFANFNWSKELIEKLSKIKCAYFFGDTGSELINLAARFRQFLYGQRADYLKPPIVICFPEDSGILPLLDAEREDTESLASQLERQMNTHFVNMISDTCTARRLLEESEHIDMLSRVINYYYSIKYEFDTILKEKWQVADAQATISTIESRLAGLSDQGGPHREEDIEAMVLQNISMLTRQSVDALKPVLGIKKRWGLLSYHKKSSNRYAARHMAVKMDMMEKAGYMPLTHENILHSFPVIAPVEHKRWCAEKMVHNYRYGPLPADKTAKQTARERLKIHDQLIPYEKMADTEKEKDLSIFLLMPLLNSLKAEIKK